MAISQIQPGHLAKAMGISLNRLWAFARNMDACFKPRRMQWDGKKHRPIDPLYKTPKKLLKKLHDFFQRNRLYHPAAHGAVRRKSCFTSARVHLRRRFVWTRDAANCYPSITPRAMFEELCILGFELDTAKILSLIFTYQGGVPQGSPVSGDALNLFFWRMDQLLASMAGSASLGYSRVADDFILSGNDRASGERVVAKLETEIEKRGMEVNKKKKQKNGLQTPSVEQIVHSISISKPGGTSISKEHSRKALKLADEYVLACRSVTCESIQAVASKRAVLSGWMYYCRQANFGPARTIKQRLDAGDRHVLRKLRAVSLSSKSNKWWIVNRKHSRNEPKRLAVAWQLRIRRLNENEPLLEVQQVGG